MTLQKWVLLFVAFILAGCSTSITPYIDADSAVEGFLAGRVAQTMGDTEAAAVYYDRALSFDPDNTVLLQRTFTLMVAEGNLTRAAELADHLRLLEENVPLADLVLGIREAKLEQFEEAELLFSSFEPSGLNDILRPLLTGWSKVGEEDLEGALADLNHSLRGIDGLDQLRNFHSAMMHDVMGNYAEAQSLYEQILSPNLTVRTVEIVGNFYQRIGRRDLAENLYAQYAKVQPNSLLFNGDRNLAMGVGAGVPSLIPDAKAGLAEALFDFTSLMRQERADGATLLFARMTLDLKPNFPLAQLMVGELQILLKQYDAANTTWMKIDKNSPIFDFAMLRKANNQNQQGDVDGAVDTLNALINRNVLVQNATIAKADIYRLSGRHPEAIESYDSAIANIPKLTRKDWSLLFSRGISLERSGRWKDAEADLIQALSLNPNQPDVLNYLGYSWIDQGINLQKGYKFIEKAVQISPNDGAIIDSLGWALYRLKRFVLAVPVLERAAVLEPADPTINDHLGDAYWQTGRKDEAFFQWKRVLTLEPNDDLRAKVEQKLRDETLPPEDLEPRP